jgi:hypothetical protein
VGNWTTFIDDNATQLLIVGVVAALFLFSRSKEILAWLSTLAPDPAPVPPTPFPPQPPVPPTPDEDDDWEDPMQHYVALIRDLNEAGEEKAVEAMEGEVWEAMGRIVRTDWED